MKIAVLNYSGNVGKTTIARHLLIPRVAGSKWIPVESINAGGSSQLNYRGREFKEVLKEILVEEAVIVDIGSSNIEEAFSQLKKMGDAHEDFDFFVIPVVPADKQQEDTLKIVGDMIEMDVDPAKIKIVFNQIPSEMNVMRTFGKLIGALARVDIEVSPNAVIHHSDVFAMLGKDQTIAAVTGDARNLKEEIAKASDAKEKARLADILLAKRLAIGVQKELDTVFRALFPDATSA